MSKFICTQATTLPMRNMHEKLLLNLGIAFEFCFLDPFSCHRNSQHLPYPLTNNKQGRQLLTFCCCYLEFFEARLLELKQEL